MIYFKPPQNMRIVDMCIWIDDNIYKDNCDDSLAFEYMYHIGRSLAKKRRFFKKSDQYNDFGIFFATRLLMRYRQTMRYNKKLTQQEKDDRKIDSVLNYAKKILYPSKVSFEQENYAQVITKEDPDEILLGDRINNEIMKSLDLYFKSDFNTYLHDIIKTTKAFLNSIPYKKDGVLWNNIYISCLLSFLNSITLPNELQKALNSDDPGYINNLYARARDDSIILYHLDDQMRDYIDVLVRRLRFIIAKDVSGIINYHIPHDINDKLMLLEGSSLQFQKDETE